MQRRFVFLHSDIESSTSHWENDADTTKVYVLRIFEIIESACKDHSGRVYKKLGDGLACVFRDPHSAVLAALQIQSKIREEVPDLKLRIGLHSGIAEDRGDEFWGSSLNQVSRICHAGHGGQILASQECWSECADHAAIDAVAVSLGKFYTRGHTQPVEIVQISAPGKREEFPPLRGIAHPSNIPKAPANFVGRTHELSEICRALLDPDTPLVSLIGFGGVGKTMIATQIANLLLPEFKNRVWWVNCEEAGNQVQIESQLRHALTIDSPDQEITLALEAATTDSPSLIVMDCFESAVVYASFIQHLVETLPKITFLVTSRIALDISSETRFLLGGVINLNAKRPNLRDASLIFEQAASNVLPGYKTPATLRKFRDDILMSVEGIPLAIILCGSRVSQLSLEHIATLVKQSLLDVAARTVNKEGRHASLRKVVEASFLLLSASQREFLLKLSVFRGGFEYNDLKPVVGGSTILDHVAMLVNSSLVNRDPDGRYKILDSVTEYLGENVNDTEIHKLRESHAEHFLKKAKAARKQGSVALSLLVAQDSANLRMAVGFLAATGKDVSLVELVDAIITQTMDGGFLYDFDEFVVLGIAAAQKTGQLLLLDRFLSLRTVRCRLAKRWDEMRNANTERVALALKLSDIPNPLDRLGEIVLAELDAPDTESSFVADRLTEIDELLSVSDVTAHQSCDYSALKVLALSKSNQSSQALELAERVYERCVTLDPPFWKAAFAFRCLGNVFLEHGNLDRAERMFIRLLDSTRPHNTSLGCFGLARCAIARVEPEIPALCCEILRQLGPQKAPQAISMRKELGLLYQEKFGRTIEIHSSWYSRWEDILSEVLRKLTHCDSDHSALCAPK